MNKARIVAEIAKLQKEQCGLSYYIERLSQEIDTARQEKKENDHLLDYYKGEWKDE